MSGHVFAGLDVRFENPAGLTGIWAEENTRASLFDAMQRKETFATSGPRIQVRLFGGWDYAADVAERRPTGSRPPTRAACRWAATCRRSARPRRHHSSSGRSRTRPPATSTASRSSRAGPRTARASRRSTTSSGPATATPDPDRPARCRRSAARSTSPNATYTNTIGAVELKGTWTDPEFDPSLDAFYYARALEIPTPRWTTIQAKELGIAPPEMVAATVQERAWSSPIWYTPTPGARERRCRRADRRRPQGARRDGARRRALTELIVGKSTWVRNNVTGEVFNIAWTTSGQRLIGNVNGGDPEAQRGWRCVARRPDSARLRLRDQGRRHRHDPRQRALRGRPSTSSATSISPRAATSSASPTTRWFQRRKLSIRWISKSRRSRPMKEMARRDDPAGHGPTVSGMLSEKG